MGLNVEIIHAVKSRNRPKYEVKRRYFEAQEIIDTTVLPALVELKNKINVEKKNWFYKILNLLYDGVKMFMGNPELTTENLVITGLSTGMNITSNFINQEYEIQKIKKRSRANLFIKIR